MATKSGNLGDSMQMDSSDDAVSQRVINAVADAKGVDPLDLDPMYDTIDPDALDALFRDGEASLAGTELRFEYEDCEVRIEGSGEVSITLSEETFVTSEAASQPDQNASRNSSEDRCGIAISVPGGLDTYNA